MMLLKIHFSVVRIPVGMEMGPSFSSQYSLAVSLGAVCLFFYGKILVSIITWINFAYIGANLFSMNNIVFFSSTLPPTLCTSCSS